jgi:hypothetical protein
MHLKLFLISLLLTSWLLFICDACEKKSGIYGKAACGEDCTGTPTCMYGRKCGNVDNMCYCQCDADFYCMTSDLGFKWNNGIKHANGSYALNGTAGDGKYYRC